MRTLHALAPRGTTLSGYRQWKGKVPNYGDCSSFSIIYGEFLFRYRNIGFPIVAILLLVAFEPGRSRSAGHESWSI